MIDWRVVPIETWPGEHTRHRKRTPFRRRAGHGPWSERGVNWSGTVELLERELKMLAAKDVLLQMAVDDRDIRLDGWIRANASPRHPGVILTFDSKHGPLSYPCDSFKDWQSNLRAIALALEALRKVDRYGVTKRGEQYRGWKQLPPAGESTVTMTAEAAATVVATAQGLYPADDLLRSPTTMAKAVRLASKSLHPDAGGSARDFQVLQQARGVLERHHGAESL